MRKWLHSYLIASIAVALVIFTVVVVLGYWFQWNWTGFPAKKLWDWLSVLAIPVVVGFGVAWFTVQQGKVSDRKNTDNQREAALQAYIDRMSELLLEKKLGKPEELSSEIENIARVRTITVLSQLDSNRRASVLQFLYEAGLIGSQYARHSWRAIVDLQNANLTRANLSYISLKGAYLRGVRLSRSNLRGADLREAILEEADLRGADLRETSLNNARLGGANLSGADLSHSDLREAYLNAANLQGADLRGAKLGGAHLNAVIPPSILEEQNSYDTGSEWEYELLYPEQLENDGVPSEMRPANLGGADLRGANLLFADLRGVCLEGTKLDGVDLSSTTLTDAKGITKDQISKANPPQGSPDGSEHP